MPTPRFIDALGHAPADKRIELLRGIALSGSISQAARDAGVSYKAAWQAIDTLTNLAGVPLVERAVGGSGGGGALLTAHGLHLLELAEALDAARQGVHARWATRGGTTDAAAAMGIDATMARLAVRTSMRNQLPVVIESVTSVGRIVRVAMRLGAAGRIAARVTQESVELLGLRTDMTAIALCKATAVRVERVVSTDMSVDNRLTGTVAAAARGESGDELAVALGDGLQVVGFAASGTGLRTRQRVVAIVDESAVVVALPG
ncbi:MAG: TOBE domain-containing protein [Pseudomonadota bacterium]